MGYGEAMIADLEKTINRSDVDMVVSATPIDLTRVIKVNKPMQRVRYELQEIGTPTLKDLLERSSPSNSTRFPCIERGHF
jgi:predicted GTPase